MSISTLITLSDKDKKIIGQIIEEQTYPCTVKTLRGKLKHSGRDIPEYLITRALRSLLSDDKVRFKGGRWMSNDLYEHVNIPQTGYSTRIVELPTLSSEGEKVISSVLTSKPIDDDSASANISVGTWGHFRKLVSYYSECLRNEEGADASAFIGDIGKKYIYASGIGDWSPKTGKKWNYVLPIGDYNQDFVQTILNQNNIDNIVIFGYPLEAVCIQSASGPDTRLIRPVFQYVLNTRFTDNTLNISTTNSQPEISLEWMKYSLKNYSQQFHFLSHCGLINQRRAIDEPMGYTSEDVRPNLEELVRRLSTFMPKKVREPLNIRSINANAIPTDFKNGIYNKAVIMIGNRTKFTQTLLKELTIIGSHSDESLNKTALKYLFTKTDDVEKILESKPHEETVADALLMNAEQRESVASILTNNISVVTGPPGTGKSQVVMGAIANARLQDKSVLFTSRNHKAIDAVVDRLKDSNGEPLIIRTNSKDDPSLSYTFRNGINDLRADSIDLKTVKNYERKHEQLTQRLIKRGERAIELENIWSLRDEIGEIEDKISWLKENLEKPILDKLMGNYQKIKKNEMKSFNHIIDFINKYSNNNSPGRWISYAFDWLSIISKWNSVENNLEKLTIDSSIGTFPPVKINNLSSIDLNLLADIVNFIEWHYKKEPLESDLKGLNDTSDLIKEIKTLNDDITDRTKELITLYSHCHKGTLPEGEDRGSLETLRVALTQLNQDFANEERSNEIEERLLKYAPILLKNFPAWAVTNLSVGSRIPLAPGIFDIAIIDEASQCDIASAIPIFFRAKQATVVGDPRQLTHVTKLTVNKDSLLRSKTGLSDLDDLRFSYRETSLYDLFASTNSVSPHLLRETYRSTTEIAEYSNQVFYNGMLRVATNENSLNLPKGTKLGIHWTEIESQVVSAGRSGCVAEAEVDAIYDLVKKILVENKFRGSLGVVTPFRQQQKRLHDRIYDGDISYDIISQAKLVVDTVHGFQGDEKDVMIFSLCAGPDMPQGSLHFIKNKSNLFNVAVSRARAVIHVVGNKHWASNCGINHIVKLAQPVNLKSVDNKNGPWYPHESPWEKILFEALLKKDIKTIPQYPASGRRLDLALVNNKTKLKIDIEVDSDTYHRNPDGSRKKDDTWRDIYLMGMGWKIMRFWVYNLRDDLDKCVAKIEKEWRNNE